MSFDKEKWQKTLLDAHVNSVTLFAKCHHGWHYNTTNVGHMHPNLGFDLLRAQFDACKEVDINAPIYISAGFDMVKAVEHPEWCCVHLDEETGETSVHSPLKAGYIRMCFNSPYTEYLVEEIREVMRQFPNCNGIFLDIVSQPICLCESCLKVMRYNGLDPRKPEDRAICAQMGLERYLSLTTQAVMDIDPEMPIFHNAGHVAPGQQALLKKYDSHLELESLPTGGWGYDHFPISAKYAATTGLDYLGMTGKFHTTWGEFGGYKDPAALRYECDAMLAYGAKCSIGDQLHPCGNLDPATYRAIGQAYADVEAKEPWCDNVRNVADIAILPAGAITSSCTRNPSDLRGLNGAARTLLEGHFLFDVIDLDANFNDYKLLILPDNVPVDAALKRRLDAYLVKGGHLLLSGSSGVGADGKFQFDLGANLEGDSPYEPDYMVPTRELMAPGFDSPMVMYLRSKRVTLVKGSGANSLGSIYEPYFNRSDRAHFSSHQHTPNQPDATKYVTGVQKDNITYLAHPVFTIYAIWGNVPFAKYLRKVVRFAMGGEPTAVTNLPSAGRMTVMEQPSENRTIVHLLYANVVQRGEPCAVVNGQTIRGNAQVIEELVPLAGTDVTVLSERPVTGVTLEPQGLPLNYRMENGRVSFHVDTFTCHQMVVLQY
ncbi:MAG: beta-galactosidase trimerization domain-containing protein [Victivallales bacterium]|nr:beta-galactosidase trimerization domain-containing protein [Victivallales bacterium]